MPSSDILDLLRQATPFVDSHLQPVAVLFTHLHGMMLRHTDDCTFHTIIFWVVILWT
jgi:hypothetical protein